jgi:HK97 family phage portal protein
MLQTLARWIGTARGKAVSSVYRLLASFGLYEFRDYESYLEAGSRKLWALYRACDIIAKAVNSTPVKVYRRGSPTPAVIPDLTQLLERYVNQHETLGDILYKSVFHITLTGMAYWLKSEVNLTGNKPKELFALNPGRLKFVLNSQAQITGYTYYSGGKPIALDLDEVIVFKHPHPNNDFLGLGVVEAGENLLTNAINRANYQKAFWKNGACPSGVMILQDQVTDEESWAKAKRAWDAEHGGNGARDADGGLRVGKIGWLTGNWKYERLGLTALEMEDLEKSKYDISQIFMLCGVPLSIAGVESAAAYATAEIDRENFNENTILPLLRLFEATLQSDLIEGFGPNLEIRFDRTRFINLARITRELLPLLQNGVVSPNEVRKAAGYLPVEDDPSMDQRYVTSAMVPMDLAGVANQDQVGQQAQRQVQDFVRKTISQEKENV